MVFLNDIRDVGTRGPGGVTLVSFELTPPPTHTPLFRAELYCINIMYSGVE